MSNWDLIVIPLTQWFCLKAILFDFPHDAGAFVHRNINIVATYGRPGRIGNGSMARILYIIPVDALASSCLRLE